MSFEMLTGPSPTPRTHILARIAAGSGTHDVAMMKASPKKTMAAYVADGEVERRAPPPRPTTATGGSRGGLGAFAHRPGSAPSSAGASPIKGAHAARRVHPSALASPVRATAAGAAASKKANDQRRREEGRKSINERTASTRAGVKAKVVTRHAPPTQAQSHAVTTLWDKISGACDNVTQALEECAKAMVEPDPNRGTPGFGNSSSNSTSAPGVSGTTRRKNASRASLKLREAKSQFNSFTGGFDELRRHSAALAAALHRSETSAGTVTEQLASTAGYAEETTNRLRTTAREKEVAEMTAKQAKSALQDALARIEVLEKERRDIRGYEARLEEADYARANFAIALERAEKAETSAARHKEGVAKLTADNMVFLMRLKETESEIQALRKETADARIELEGKRGAWFDRARKDVERVVQRSIKRAEESDAALELEFEKQERTAEEFAMELAKINDVRAENELLAMAAAKAQKAAESALMEKVKIYEELQRWKTKEFDASSSAKASTTAAAEAYESAGVLRKELNETKAELAGARSFVDAARAEVDAKTTALANQQAVNAGVMKMKNAMEWRVLEMQTALEQRGIAPPPPSAPPPNSSTSSIGPSSISEWTAGATTVSKTVGGTLPPTPATVPPHQTTGGASSNAGNEIRTIPGFELSPLPASDLKPTPAPISLVTPQNASYGSAEHSHSAAKEFVMDALNESPHSTAAFFGLSSPGKEIPKISPPTMESNAANFAHFRAMFPDLQGEGLEDIEGLDTLDVSGAPSLRSDAKLAGDSTPPVKRRNKRRAAADANDASTAAPLIARGTTKQSYGATSPAAGELKTLGSGTSPKKPPAGPGPEVRQTKKSAAAAAANRAVYASVDSVKASLVNDDDVLRARAIHAARERSTPPIGSPARVPPPSTDQKAKEEFDAFLREVEDDSVHDHPYQPLRSSESDVTSEGGTSLESAQIRPPPNPWLNDPRDAEGAAGGSPGREFPPLGAMTLGGGGGSPSRRSPSRKSPAKRPPAVGELATAPSMAAKGGASFKASMAAAAAAAAGSVVDSANVLKDSPDADDDLLDAFSDDVDNGAILRMFQAGALDNDDAKRETAAARAMESAANANVSGFRAEFFGETTDDDDGHELVSEDVFERAAARALAKRGEGGGQEGTRINPNPNPTPFDGPGWIGADGPGPARSNSFASARTSLLAVDGSSDEDQERARVASGVPTRAVAFDDSESDPDSTDADSIYDVFKNPGASGYVPTAGTQRRPELSRFASSSNGQGLDEEHAAAMDRLMASGGRTNDGGRPNAGGGGDDLPRVDDSRDGGGFTFSNALPGSGRVPVPDNTGTSADRPATARGRSRGGGVSFSNALPSIR